MERYFPKVAKASSSAKSQEKNTRYHPYKPTETIEGRDTTPLSKRKLTLKEVNKGLLSSLANASNPITHSDIRNRSDRIVSISTGHQIAEERINRRLYLEHRQQKLKVQSGTVNPNINGVLYSCSIYLSGYLNGTTDIEMKRIIANAGGQTVPLMSQCTHIVTSQWLSGRKYDMLVTGRMRNKPFLVRPEWVLDSLSEGKRQAERKYAIINNNR